MYEPLTHCGIENQSLASNETLFISQQVKNKSQLKMEVKHSPIEFKATEALWKFKLLAVGFIILTSRKQSA